ncbi:hypothetical protein FQA47_001762 [Xyrichtys novacula]|uniref:Uncharacterized protein n=1 Tax=Xyrichtys novacula TaxID=13765 RepID=A0AAV1FAK5_XYRNO|nr:hypothetical protein FQA47_001762 [Xyrichtys novacula]
MKGLLEDTPRVVSWSFEGSSASPICVKQNKTAIISDGESITKIVVFESLVDKVVEGEAYFMCGHTLMGKSPPYTINVGSGTQFFRGSKITYPAELKTRAEALLHPALPLVPLHQCREQQGLMSVEGVVIEDQSSLKVSLWREVALEPLIVGEAVRVTHVKSQRTEYELLVNATNWTKIEKQQTSQDIIIVGVLDEGGATSSSSSPGKILEVLLQSGETLQIQSSWGPSFDEAISEGPLHVKASVEGKLITNITIKNN